jgi:geranylgeranyl pyrophosphate synthase
MSSSVHALEASKIDINKIHLFLEMDLKRMENGFHQFFNEDNELLNTINEYALNSCGKRLRPILVLLSSKIFDAPQEQRILLAGAIELIHIATLIHDDIIDDSDTRRFKETLRTKWGINLSLVAGDYLFTAAFSLLSRIDNPKIGKILSIACRNICLGEIEQLTNRYNSKLNLETYFKIIKRKTAALFAASCETGACLGNSTHIHQKRFEEFGRNIGVAFQIIDDCLDLTSESYMIGKNSWNDFSSGKLTLPLIYLLMNPEFKKIQEKDIFEYDKDELRNLLFEFNVVDESIKTAQSLVDKAKSLIEDISDCYEKTCLNAIADYVVERSL